MQPRNIYLTKENLPHFNQTHFLSARVSYLAPFTHPRNLLIHWPRCPQAGDISKLSSAVTSQPSPYCSTKTSVLPRLTGPLEVLAWSSFSALPYAILPPRSERLPWGLIIISLDFSFGVSLEARKVAQTVLERCSPTSSFQWHHHLPCWAVCPHSNPTSLRHC